MNEIMDMILTLTQDIKTVKAYLLNFHKSRLEQFSEEWIDGQVVMQTLHKWKSKEQRPFSMRMPCVKHGRKSDCSQIITVSKI